jgi:hypothetical protein
MEQMTAAVVRAHVACFGAGALPRQPYSIERIPGKTLPPGELPISEEARAIVGKIAAALAAARRTSSITTSPAASCFVPAAKPC